MKIQFHRIDTNVVVGLLVREFCCSGTDVSAKVLAMYAGTRTPSMEPQWLAAGLSQNGYKDDFEKTAEYLADAGIASVAFTFCGGSTRDESGFPTTQMTLFTEKEDLIAIFERMEQEASVDKDHIFLFGASQGGLISAMAAEEYKEKIAGMILLYPALCIADNWRERFASEDDIPKELDFWGMQLGDVFFKSMRTFETFKVLGHFSSPVLILHGIQDEIVPIEYSVKAVKQYPNAKLEQFANEPHGFTEDGNRRMEAMMLYFIHECMESK